MKSSSFRHAGLAVAVFGAAAALGPACGHAQWSANPGDNLIVADEYADQTQPKIVATPDGGYYVSWFDDIAHGFGIHLQRLDAQGNELWEHDGILVAERQLGFTYDYGLAIDADGNAYLGYNCCANNSDDEHIAVSKVTPDGTLEWGAAGITVSAPASTERPYAAHLAMTSDGFVAVAWSVDPNFIRVQKLDVDGAAQWTQGGVAVNPPNGLALLADIEPSDAGNVIVSWSNQAGPARTLRAQKLAAADGAGLWGTGGVRVFGQGGLQMGYFPEFIDAGDGGAVFYDYDVVGVRFFARVQRLDANGAPMLDPNGVLTTTDTVNDHVATAAAFDRASGDIYAIWIDTVQRDDMQVYDGVYAQRVDASGQRQWGDTGKELVPMAIATDGTHSISQLTAVSAPSLLGGPRGGFIGSWTTGAIPAPDQPITATRLDQSGNYVWDAQNVAIKNARPTGRTVAVKGASGNAVIYAWQDGADGATTIRVQNLRGDGTLGNPILDRIFADGFDGG
ncbi:hypothetical protein [Dokdonella sp.]|uniref:hypothetical protein n=1 Tax=Dokdonella sp. TaxID=2291710 RepID=UPI001B18E514|nr:hypothetical protein [Dokdonella sp.]MBO9662163.1 hypothetical protein [Dokdonella sp.]